MWRYESRGMYEKAEPRVNREASIVGFIWDNQSSQYHGKSKIISTSENWIVRTDVWKMDKHKNNDSVILMAITRKMNEEDDFYLKSLRDLSVDHIPALLEIDEQYPDSKWIKYIQYPPFVWRLHVHIEERQKNGVSHFPFRNSYLLADVIKMVQTRECEDLLVWVPLVAERA